MPRDIVFYSVKEVNQKSKNPSSLFFLKVSEGFLGKDAMKGSFLHGFLSLPISQEKPDCIMSFLGMMLSGFFVLQSVPVDVIRGRSLQVYPGNR